MSNSRRDFAYGAHLALVGALGLGRILGSIEATKGSSLPSSSTGRALALLAMVAGMSALVAVVVLTILERRDSRLSALVFLLAAALWSRAQPDVPDLIYASAAVVLGAWWFLKARGETKLGNH